ncbi:MAG: flavodoxin domain-containing protein [Anaerolineales bacterium]|nr:flavodoxin domain-containing protein [Anaerolineales bacterium]
MKALVAYATNTGTTMEVANAIGDEIKKNGVQVDVLPLEQVSDLSAYQAVVLGAPMIVGWHRSAAAFLKRNQPVLSSMPVALFITCMNLTRLDTTSVSGTPVTIDEKLAVRPQNPERLNAKERYTTLDHYIQPILRAAPAVKPVNIAIFGGRLDLYRLNFLQKLFVLLVIQAQPGDRRNWDAIRQWAGALALT